MVCPHCGGYMVYEKSYGQNEPSCTWKCLLCGEYVDNVIMMNRLFQGLKCKRTRTMSRAKTRPEIALPLG